MIVYSSSSESSYETDNEQTQDRAQNVAFSSENVNDFQHAADDTRSDDESQYTVGTEGGALPRPAWMDASAQDDARVQSIRDIIRVSDCTFM